MVPAASLGAPRGALKILLIDDRPIIREGVRLILDRQPDLEVIAHGSTMEEVQPVPEEPDVILTEIYFGNRRDPSIIERLRSMFPAAPVLVLTLAEDPGDAAVALGLGARGYTSKSSRPSDLIDGIRTVAGGGAYLDPTIGAAVAQAAAWPGGQTPHSLSPRERDILSLIAQGFTNAEAAAALGVSVRTVEGYRGQVVKKLGLRTRAELARYARDAGLLERERFSVRASH